MLLRRLGAGLLAAMLLVPAAAAPAAARPAGAQVVPMAVTSGVNVVASSTVTDSILGWTWIIGQIENDTMRTVQFSEVTAELFDTADQPVGTKTGYAAYDMLDPGERTSFSVGLKDAQFATYKIKLDYSAALSPANHYFAVTVSGSSLDSVDILHVTGTVQNLNTVAASDVLVIAEFYDTTNKLIGLDWDYLSEDVGAELAAGASQSFEVDVLTPPPAYDHMTVIADAMSAPQLATTLGVAPATPKYGATASLAGVASPGASVTFQRMVLGTGWTDIDGLTATADTNGAFSASLKVTARDFVRAVTAAGNSVPVAFSISALVTAKAAPATAKRGSTVVLSGAVKPAYPAGTKLTIQRKVGSSWKTFATTKTTASGTWTYRWKTTSAGTWQFRVVVPNGPNALTGVSSIIKVVVK